MVGSKTNLGLGPIFMPTTKETLLTSKKLCGNWQAKEKHTRNYQLVGWRISFFSTYQRLGPMSQRKSYFQEPIVFTPKYWNHIWISLTDILHPYMPHPRHRGFGNPHLPRRDLELQQPRLRWRQQHPRAPTLTLDVQFQSETMEETASKC